MKIAVVVPTVDRSDALLRITHALAEQTLAPSTVVVSPPDRSTLPQEVMEAQLIKVVDGARGASAQRNLALSAVPEDVDLVAFFDDDAIPRVDYLEQMAQVFEDPTIVGATGEVVRDGALEKRELTPDEMTQALQDSIRRPEEPLSELRGLYGANMVVRADLAREIGFDERLPLYSWLEDLDFSRQLLRRGRLVKAPQAVCVHQGSNSGGRRQHRRLGYSQICNPLYLWRKGSLEPKDLAVLVSKPVLASLRGSIIGDERPERRERLKGMGLALGDLVRGRFTPERITEL